MILATELALKGASVTIIDADLALALFTPLPPPGGDPGPVAPGTNGGTDWNELYAADGYRNRRVVVFVEVKTRAYDDPTPEEQGALRDRPLHITIRLIRAGYKPQLHPRRSSHCCRGRWRCNGRDRGCTR